MFSSRFLGGEEHRVLHFWHAVGNKFLTLLSNMCTNLNLTDIESGYKVFKRAVIEKSISRKTASASNLRSSPRLLAWRFRIYEVGVSYAGRTYEEGKKINWKDGIRALWCIAKYSRSRPLSSTRDLLTQRERSADKVIWVAAKS